MAGIGMIIKLVGAEKLIKSLTSKDTVSKPAQTEIKKLAMSAKAELIKATVVAEGTARSNIAAAPIQYAAFSALITHSSGPGQSYIPYLESGSQHGPTFVPSRHMEGKVKVLGVGMFSYVRKWLVGKMSEATRHIAKDIEDQF